MAANRRRSGGFPAADLLMDDGWGGRSSRDNDDDDEFDDKGNPFESIGRELDKCEEVGAMMDPSRLQLPAKRSPKSHEWSIDGRGNNIVDSSSSSATGISSLHTQENEKGYPQQKENLCKQSQSHDVTNEFATNETRQQDETIINTQSKNTPSRDNNVTQLSQVSRQRKVSPHRFTFQSSTKPKSTTFKTPSRSSLSTEDLFSSSAMSQRVTANRSTRKSIGNVSIQKRNHRHTFRKSIDRSNTPAGDNSVREMRFVPTFLGNAKVGHDNAHEDTSDTPGENDDDTDFPQNESYPLFTHNIVSDYHRRQQLNQLHRKSEQSNGKSGYLVQRLRSLRNADQRMAMHLRSGHITNSGSTTMSRKRRRSGDDYCDPRTNVSTIMDVTVSCASQSVYEFDEGKTVLLAYIHSYTATKQLMDHCEDQCDGLKYPCFALLLMSRDDVLEQGIVGSTSKQLRIYDGVVLPPRVDASDEGMPGSAFLSNDMPTIIRTHLCEELPLSVPLPDVTFPPFSGKAGSAQHLRPILIPTKSPT